jgi:hypothetical protein
MMVKESNLIHPGQIITTEKIIKTVLWEASLEVSPGAIMLLHTGLNTQEDYLRLFSVAARLEHLGRLVYKGKEGIKKPDSKVYDYWIFETSSGVRDEIREILDSDDCMTGIRKIEDCEIEDIYRMYQALQRIWVRMVSNVDEVADITEYAYAFEYIYNHGPDTPEPEYKGCELFPCNYEDFNHTTGVAEYFNKIIVCKT